MASQLQFLSNGTSFSLSSKNCMIVEFGAYSFVECNSKRYETEYSVSELVSISNVYGVSQVQVTVLAVNNAILPQSLQMSFPVSSIDIDSSTLNGCNSVIIYNGNKYYAEETEDAIVTASNVSGSPYLVYTAIFSQEGKSILSDGLLEIGEKYCILTYQAGDDFTNVGASENVALVEFVATGTTPTNWSNGSQLMVNFDPVIYVLENTIGDISLVTNNAGHYRLDSDSLYTTNKTAVFINSTISSDLIPFQSANIFNSGTSQVYIELYQMSVSGGELVSNVMPTFERFNLEIRVYQ